MSNTASELTAELVQLQRDYRAYSLKPEYKYVEMLSPPPGGFIEKYQKRTKEIQKAIAGLR